MAKMKKRTMIEAMKNTVTNTLEGVPTDLLSISMEESTNKESGEISRYVKFEAEVPKGYDSLSRCRFTVKVPNATLKVTEEQLLDDDYDIFFKGLEISFIDQTGNVYFRAEDYSIKKAAV